MIRFALVHMVPVYQGYALAGPHGAWISGVCFGWSTWCLNIRGMLWLVHLVPEYQDCILAVNQAWVWICEKRKIDQASPTIVVVNIINYILWCFLLQKWKQQRPSRFCKNLCSPYIILNYETSIWGWEVKECPMGYIKLTWITWNRLNLVYINILFPLQPTFTILSEYPIFQRI